ncbi:MAG: S8 family serine peptidase, partial [Planctomycetota bacterium]
MRTNRLSYPVVRAAIETLEPRRLLASLSDLAGLDALQLPATPGFGDEAPLVNNAAVAEDAPAADPRADLFWLANHLPADELQAFERVDTNLLALYSRQLRAPASFSGAEESLGNTRVSDAFIFDSGMPMVSVSADDIAGVEALAAELVDAGLRLVETAATDGYATVDAYLPIGALSRVVGLDSVRSITMQAKPVTWASQSDGPSVNPRTGSVDSEWDLLSGAEQLRRVRPALDGNIIDFGVMSDSINRVGGGVAASVATGDLPTGIVVLDDYTASDASDEGRAMAELMYDIAPASDFIYHTAFEGLNSFAQGIDDLRVAGADVIVDDIGYAQDPAFQDGVVTQAVDNVYLNHDVLYFSSAGNANGETYFGTWSDSDGDDFHAFNGGSDEQLNFNLAPGQQIRSYLQWDDAWGSADRDFDFFLYDSNDNIVASSTTNNNGVFGIGRTDPYEFLSYTNPSSTQTRNYYLAISYSDGDSPNGTRFFLGTFDINPGNTADNDWGGPAVYGHSNARFGFGVGASPWFNPTTIEPFSSTGGIPVTRSDSGVSITPQFRQNPAFVAADGVSNTFFGNSNNFFGTSAAAPNAAAVAGLLQEANGGARSLTWTETRDLFRDSAVDLGASGYDDVWGWGRIDALHAGILADGPFSNENYIELNQFGDGTFRADLISNTDLDRVFYAFDNAGFATTTVDAPVYDVAMQVFQTSNESLIGLDSE